MNLEADVDEGMTIPPDAEPVPAGDEPQPATPETGDEEDGLGIEDSPLDMMEDAP